MNGTDIFIDINICIFLLSGDLTLAELLQGQNLFISIITEMELHSSKNYDPSALQVLGEFLHSVSIINIEDNIKDQTIKIRKSTSLKLPDSIIAASAIAYNFPLLTADTGFKKVNHLDLILYETH